MKRANIAFNINSLLLNQIFIIVVLMSKKQKIKECILSLESRRAGLTSRAKSVYNSTLPPNDVYSSGVRQ